MIQNGEELFVCAHGEHRSRKHENEKLHATVREEPNEPFARCHREPLVPDRHSYYWKKYRKKLLLLLLLCEI